MYATQMARAYPSIDVNEAFALAATHWRVKNRYFASAGTGGYCLPVATRYLEEGAPVPEALTIGRAASDFEVDQRAFVADLLMRRATGPVGILGLSYRADLPAWTLSPFVDVARRLCGAGVDVRLHDPIISWQSIVGLESATPLKFPTGLAACSVLFLGAAHSQYRTELEAWLALNLQRGQIVVDNEGAWEGASGKFGEAGVEYLRIGGAKWTLVEAAT
jgi:UDP-N-acetyl-D-mannosaminuronate dehydrogenase